VIGLVASTKPTISKDTFTDEIVNSPREIRPKAA